jgi:2-methylaconitate cis-trans-isomerase PrpF
VIQRACKKPTNNTGNMRANVGALVVARAAANSIESELKIRLRGRKVKQERVAIAKPRMNDQER